MTLRQLVWARSLAPAARCRNAKGYGLVPIRGTATSLRNRHSWWIVNVSGWSRLLPSIPSLVFEPAMNFGAFSPAKTPQKRRETNKCSWGLHEEILVG
jgi:hypothetical protein